MTELIFFILVVLVFAALLIWMEFEKYKTDKKLREYLINVLLDKDGTVEVVYKDKYSVRRKVAKTSKDIK
jgi:hypothetical protein